MVRDVVCGMEVDEAKTRYKLDWYGGTYYFCSEKCLRKFQEDPLKYTGSEFVRRGDDK